MEQEIEIHSAVGMQGVRKLHATFYNAQRERMIELELAPEQVWSLIQGGVTRATAIVYEKVPEPVDHTNRCGHCGQPLRDCCYTCPSGPHEDMCGF